MKILMLVPSLEEKGPIIVAENISKFSSDKNIEYIYVSLKKNNYKNLERFKKFKVFELDINKNIFGIINSVKKIKDIVETYQVDLIHAHCFIPTMLITQIKKIKKITTLHNNPWKDYTYSYGNIVGTIMAIIQSRCIKSNNLNVAISNYIKLVYSKKEDMIKVVYNGVEKINFEKNNNKTEILKLITVSVLNKIKNVYQIIDIIQILKKQGYKVELIIIGSGPEKEKLQKYALKKNVDQDIIWLGTIERSKIFDIVKESDIFILTSKSEGFGLVVVEAMSVGVPSIVSNIPVMKEIVKSNYNGMIANNSNEFAEGIINIKNNLLKYSENSVLEYNKKFKVETMSESYEKIYKKLLEDDYN